MVHAQPQRHDIWLWLELRNGRQSKENLRIVQNICIRFCKENKRSSYHQIKLSINIHDLNYFSLNSSGLPLSGNIPEMAWKMTGAGKGSLSKPLVELFCGVDGAEPFLSAGIAATSASSCTQHKIIQHNYLKVKTLIPYLNYVTVQQLLFWVINSIFG